MHQTGQILVARSVVDILDLDRHRVLAEILQRVQRVQEFLALVGSRAGIIRLREIVVTLIQNLHASEEEFKTALPYAVV